MKLQFIGADHEVTGSCHYLQAGDCYMLVDYGMEQGVNRFENCPLSVPESQINFVFFNACPYRPFRHVAAFVRSRFPRQDLYNGSDRGLMQHYAPGLRPHSAAGGGVEKQEGKTPCRNRSRGAVVYDGGCAGCHQLYRTMPVWEKLEINDNVTIRFTDVGHLLGSASIEVWLKEEGCSRKLVFQGISATKISR